MKPLLLIYFYQHTCCLHFSPQFSLSHTCWCWAALCAHLCMHGLEAAPCNLPNPKAYTIHLCLRIECGVNYYMLCSPGNVCGSSRLIILCSKCFYLADLCTPSVCLVTSIKQALLDFPVILNASGAGSFITFLLSAAEFWSLPPLSGEGVVLKAFPPGCLNYLTCRNQTFSLLSSCGF